MDICKSATHMAERKFNIPQNLLRAISLTESGRWLEEDKANIAWPWTVASGGAGEFFPTKEQAIAHVRDLQAKGVTNIDVGCMQINLRYHPEAFKNLNEAFDPYRNAQYAGNFLARLFENTKSWSAAAGSYHSNEPTRNMYYREKVLSYWNYANKQSHEERQQVAEKEKTPETVILRDHNRMAMLNNNFRTRMVNHRAALEKADKVRQQLAQYRNTRYGQVLAAKNQALREQKQKRLLTVQPQRTERTSHLDFSKRRAAQLEKWRKTVANPELFDQTTPVSVTTTQSIQQ